MVTKENIYNIIFKYKQMMYKCKGMSEDKANRKANIYAVQNTELTYQESIR